LLDIEIRRLAIIAPFSDDELMEVFVLKGGNTIDLIYKLDYRASQDIDVSMCGDFEEGVLEEVWTKLARALDKTFKERGYNVFDVHLKPRPSQLDENKKISGAVTNLNLKLLRATNSISTVPTLLPCAGELSLCERIKGK